MAFEVYVPRTGFSQPVSAGRMRINRCGYAVFCATDAAAVGIQTSECIALVDVANARLALRACRDGEVGLRVKTKTGKGRPTNRYTLNANGLLQRLGLDPDKMHGDYELLTKDDLLIVHFNTAKKGK